MKAHDDALQSMLHTIDEIAAVEELNNNEEHYLNQWINEGKITDSNTLETVVLAVEQKRITLTLQDKLNQLSSVLVDENGEMREKWNKEEDELDANELKKMLKKIDKLNAAYDTLIDEIVEKTDYLHEEVYDSFIEEIEIIKDYLSSSKDVYESELAERKNAVLLKDKINNLINEWAAAQHNESSFLLEHEKLKNEVMGSALNTKTKTELIRLLDVVPSYFLENNIKDVEKGLGKFEDRPSTSTKKNILELYKLKLIIEEMKRQIKNDSNKQFLADKINEIDKRINTAYDRLQNDILTSRTFRNHLSNLSKLTGQLNKERIKIQEKSHLYRWGQKKRAIKKIEMLEKKIEHQQKYLENMYPDHENKIAAMETSRHKKMTKYLSILSNAREAVNASAQIFPDARGPAGFIYQKLKTNAQHAVTTHETLSASWKAGHDISPLYESYQAAITNIEEVLAMHADMKQDKKSLFARLKGGPIVELLKREPPYIKDLKKTRETLVNNFKEKALNAVDIEIKNELARAQALNDHTSGRDGLTIMYRSFLNNLAESIKQHADADEIMRHYQSLQSLKSNIDFEENIKQFKMLQIQDLTEKMQLINNNVSEWKNHFPHQRILNDELMTAHDNLLQTLSVLQNPPSYFDENTSQQNLDRIGDEIKSIDTKLFHRMSAYVSSLANDEIEKIKILSSNANEENIQELAALQEQIEDSVNHINHDNVVSAYKFLHKIEDDIEKIETSMKGDNLYYAQHLMEKRNNTLSALASLRDNFPSSVMGQRGQQLDNIDESLHELRPMEIFNQNNLSYRQLKEEDEALQKLTAEFQRISGSIQLQNILAKETARLNEWLNDFSFSDSSSMKFNQHNLAGAYFLLHDVIGKKQLETGNENYLYAFIGMTQALSERNFEKINGVYADFLKALPNDEKTQVKNLVQDAMMQNYQKLSQANRLIENTTVLSSSQLQKIKKENYDTILTSALNRLNVFISSVQHNEKINMDHFLDFYDIENQQMKSDYAWLFAHNKEFTDTFNRAARLANQHQLLEFSKKTVLQKSLKELDADKEHHHEIGSPRFFSSTHKPKPSSPDITERPKPKIK